MFAASATNLEAALISIERVSFQLRTFGGFVRCLYGGTTEVVEAALPLTHTRAGSREYTLGLLTIQAHTFRGNTEGCPATGTMSGTFAAARPAQTVTFL